jgi:hypothetical protein
MRAAAKKTAENDRLVDGLKRENRKGGDNPELVEAASSIGDWMSRAEKLRMQAEGLGTPLKGTPEYIRQGVLRRRAAELTAKAKGLMREVGMTTRGEMMEMGPEEKKKLGEVGATLRRFLLDSDPRPPSSAKHRTTPISSRSRRHSSRACSTSRCSRPKFRRSLTSPVSVSASSAVLREP